MVKISQSKENKAWFSSQTINFLTCCSRAIIDEEVTGKIKSLIAPDLDWPAIITKAKNQGVAQFLYFHLAKLEEVWSIVPDELKKELREFYHRILANNWLIQNELKKIIPLLDRVCIEVIVLKGASLLGSVYKNIAFRPMIDVDLLVRKQDLPRAKTILHDIGYRKPDFLDQQSLEKFGGEIHLYKNGGVFLDIHTTLSQYERFEDILKIDSDEELWNKTRRFNNGEGEIRMLGPDHLLMHLCMHQALAHWFAGLFRFCDLRETILAYKEELDFEYIIKKARIYKINKILYFALSSVQELFGPILPQDFLANLQYKHRLTISIGCFLFRKKILSLPDKEVAFRKSINQLFLMDNFSDLPQIIFKGFFPSDDWLRYRYGVRSRIKLFFYRLIHPFITAFNILS